MLAHLVGVAVEIEVLQEAGEEFAEERVVGLVDGPQAPVGVVVGAGARAERTHCKTNDTAAAVSSDPDYFRQKASNCFAEGKLKGTEMSQTSDTTSDTTSARSRIIFC